LYTIIIFLVIFDQNRKSHQNTSSDPYKLSKGGWTANGQGWTALRTLLATRNRALFLRSKMKKYPLLSKVK